MKEFSLPVDFETDAVGVDRERELNVIRETGDRDIIDSDKVLNGGGKRAIGKNSGNDFVKLRATFAFVKGPNMASRCIVHGQQDTRI